MRTVEDRVQVGDEPCLIETRRIVAVSGEYFRNGHQMMKSEDGRDGETDGRYRKMN